MRHSLRDPKTGRFARRQLKVWMGRGGLEELRKTYLKVYQTLIAKLKKQGV